MKTTRMKFFGDGHVEEVITESAPVPDPDTNLDVISELEEMRAIGESVDYNAPNAQHRQHPAVIIGRMLGRIDVLLAYLKS